MAARLIACFLSVLLIACGGQTTVAVSYEGSFLFINGLSFPRPGSVRECGDAICSTESNVLRRYVPGLIILEIDRGEAGAITRLINLYGLAINQQTGVADFFIFQVDVPRLYEQQWATAFRRESGVRFSGTRDLQPPDSQVH